jgi:penicillin-insensitive murein endopeptidase
MTPTASASANQDQVSNSQKKGDAKETAAAAHPEAAEFHDGGDASLAPEKVQGPAVPTYADGAANIVSDSTTPYLEAFQSEAVITTSTKNKHTVCLSFGEEFCLPALDNPRDQAVGLYFTNKAAKVGGSLINPQTLTQEGEGYRQKSNSRIGAYGTDHAIQFVTLISKKIKDAQVIDLLIIGDISKKSGGPFLAADGHLMHESHQNGLDVDIGFLPSTSTQTLTDHFPKGWITTAGKISRQMDLQKNWQLVKTIVDMGWSYLILVHPAVKKAFCKMAAKSDNPSQFNEMLSHIVPEKSHVDHFHVRLKCPVTSPACIPEPPRSSAPGC